MPVGVAVPRRDGRDQEQEDGDGDDAERQEARPPVERVARPHASEKPRTSRRFPTTEPVSDPRTTSVSPSFTAISAMISSGAFPNVAFMKPPMPGPVSLGGVLRRLADQPREGDQRDGGEDELDRLVEVDGVVEHDRERPEEQADEEDAADHEREP